MFAFEKALVYHCSPTLSGLKPANLLSLSKRDYPHLPELAEEYSLLLSSKGIQLEIVCSCGQRWLLLVFRPRCSLNSWQTGGPLRCCGRRAIRSWQTGRSTWWLCSLI